MAPVEVEELSGFVAAPLPLPKICEKIAEINHRTPFFKDGKWRIEKKIVSRDQQSIWNFWG